MRPKADQAGAVAKVKIYKYIDHLLARREDGQEKLNEIKAASVDSREIDYGLLVLIRKLQG